ncbi:MAG: hypothetical protein IJN97_01105 [Oscillospiraceae bacterium]|nr:hypothetical protein [Oscillospiraceae bacterium]MBQ6698411.1 hypothetical protein [Oscillospiraceae bacterium]MBQ7053797.1 hypothetical protein [Oscillospiraceae bacterium]
MFERAKSEDKLLVGVRVGGRCTAKEILDEIYHFCSSPLVNVCYILAQSDATREQYLQWAAALKETKTYFFIHNYGVDISKELADKIREIAGELYLGAFAWKLNEWGTKSSTAPYFVYDSDFGETNESSCSYDNTFKGEEEIDDLEESFARNRRVIRERLDECQKIHGGIVAAHEATAHMKYLCEGGQRVVFAELMNAYLETQVACARGATRGYKNEEWGANIAHEWYGGLDNDDPLKLKRLKLVYDYTYISGASYIFIESGEQNIRSYGVYHPEEHEIPQTYKKTREDFVKNTKDDIRPSCGPLCKVGIIHGNLDPYAGFGTSSLMYHRRNEDWTVKSPEHSWELLKKVKKSMQWHEPIDFGEYSLSNAPAYGAYDVVPIESDVDVLSRYEYLMFLGWNTMTEEIYEKLKEYVKHGGKLLLSAAHLNTNTKRDGKFIPLRDGKLSEFLGCDITGSVRRDSGVKFLNNTMLSDVHYPAAATREATDKHVDQLLCSGYTDFATLDITSATPVAYSNNTYQLLDDDTPLLVENKYGDGVVSFVTAIQYPGAPEVRNLYSYIMKAQMTASHRGCDVHVIAGDKIEFTVYDAGDGKKKLYLLNTDYTLPNTVIIKTAKEEKTITLASLERKEITVNV